MTDSSQHAEGYDIRAVEAWIASHVESLQPPFQWQRLEGGHSNLTYRITSADGAVGVIRRPPRGELLPKAHDMSREWALISALGPTPVPVAAALGFCESPDITGAWFYVMGHVDGRPLYSGDDAREWISQSQRLMLGESFIGVLAELHKLDPDSIGLGTLSKKDAYVTRQIKTWYRSWTSSAEVADYDDERTHAIQQRLMREMPEQGPARVVHGDYGLHNVLIDGHATVAAVVDWEISTLGDPLADLAYALNQWAEPDDLLPVRDNAPTSIGGFHTRDALAHLYATRTGADLSRLSYYTAFNWWKSACIVHGVYARYCAGQKSTEGVDIDGLRERIGRYLTLSSRAMENA
jgi:aminoglycoside phosphotransferase (APT) family kinase protein